MARQTPPKKRSASPKRAASSQKTPRKTASSKTAPSKPAASKKAASGKAASGAKRGASSAKRAPSAKAKAKRGSAAKAKAQAGRPSLLWRVVRASAVAGLVAFVGGCAALAALFYVFSLDMPHLVERDDFKPKQVTRIYSADGHVVDELVAPDGLRTVVPFDAIAPVMREAILAAEDADFYKHQGLDYYGMVRALYYAVRYNRRQGASTVTQQVVKNLILTPEKRLKRKIQEIMLARQLEEHLTKDDILYIYLNQIYFGHGRYGVEEAARWYFGVRAKDLTLPQAAMLAGVVQSPERLSPLKHPERALKRRRYVLEQLWKKGFVGEASARAAMEAPLGVVKDRREVYPHMDAAPYYTAHVKRLLERKYPGQEVSALGLHVRTALHLERQAEAQRALRAGIQARDAKGGAFRRVRRLKPDQIEGQRARLARQLEREGLRADVAYEGVVLKVQKDTLEVAVGDREGAVRLPEAARFNPDNKPLDALYQRGDVLRLMPDKAYPARARDAVFLMDPGVQGAVVMIDVATRRVEALVGGYDFAASSFNRATQARRQTGSAFKPFVYGAALMERASTPATVWLDAPTPFQLPGGKRWSPKNSDRKFLGALTMRRALALSRNVVAVQLLQKTTIPKAQRFARSLGLESPLVDNYTMALGSSEMTVLEVANAYTTLAAQGRYHEPVVIVAIQDAFGRVLERAPDAPGAAAIPEEVAWLTADLMTSVLTEGTASKVGRRFKRPAAGKTGTTNRSRDAWFVGFTPQKTTAVWIGRDDNLPLGPGASGGSTAAPVWLDCMAAAHRDLPLRDFPKPDVGLVDASIDPATGLLAPPSHPNPRREHFLTGTAPTAYAPEPDATSASDFLLNQGQQIDASADAEAPDDDAP